MEKIDADRSLDLISQAALKAIPSHIEDSSVNYIRPTDNARRTANDESAGRRTKLPVTTEGVTRLEIHLVRNMSPLPKEAGGPLTRTASKQPNAKGARPRAQRYRADLR